jgi:hypothetical protein
MTTYSKGAPFYNAISSCLADGSDPAYCASTSVTFEPARHTASIPFRTPGLLGMPPNGSKIRRGEAPQVGAACENPLLDRKQPTSLSEYAHSLQVLLTAS